MKISKITQNSKLCRTLTGLTPEKFRELTEKVSPLWQEAMYAKTPKNKRKHAVGAGRRYQLSVEEAILLVLIHFRTYETLAFLGFLFNVDLSTAYRYIQRFEPLIASVMDIPKDRDTLSRQDILMIVDATEQETERRKGTGYSGKTRKQSVKTQIIVNRKGKVLHVSASFPGNVHDKKLYDATGVRLRKKDLADLGYLGTDLRLPVKASKYRALAKQDKIHNQRHSRVRVVIEHVFASLKKWKILAYRFRSSLKRYNLIFRTVCGLRNLMTA